MTQIHAETARLAWLAQLEHIHAQGRQYTDQDGRECIELINVLLTVQNPADTLELVREMQRQGSWVYPSPEELKSIILGSMAQGAHEYSYVPRLFGKTNQIDDFVIPLLRDNPQSRRAVVSLYNPEIDSKVTSANVPGLMSIQFRIVNGLEMTCYVRSNDAFIGFPANVYQMRCLQEYVASRLGVQPGMIHVFSGSAHFFTEYKELYEHVSKQLKARKQ